MKVNTDGVLLGALMTIDPDDRKALDIGTGTGTIALMAAQRFPDMAITAIDIDRDSAEEAAANFRASHWKGSLTALHASLNEFAGSCNDCFDLIFSNPPYFDDSLEAPEARRNNARHTSSGLSYREILDFCAERLSGRGRFAIVLPSDQEQRLTRYARMCGMHLFRITRVRTVPRKSPSRIIAEFSRVRCESPEDKVLTIQNEGQYTQEYLSLMHDFYIFA